MKTVRLILLVWMSIFAIKANAQIGYQVSLLNSATGEPRGGETVSVDIKLTNSENATVYTTRQTATSNDFGVLSLSVGDAKTFDDMNWSKLPLYIEVSIDGVLIAKSQVLSVPVAEYAKKSGFVLTKEFLASKTWIDSDGWYTGNLKFFDNGTYEWNNRLGCHSDKYYIIGEFVMLRTIREIESTKTEYYKTGYYIASEKTLIVEEQGYR